jgi:hypothetical protein
MYTQDQLADVLGNLTVPEQRYLITALDRAAGNRPVWPKSGTLNTYQQRKLRRIATRIWGSVPAAA